MDFKKCSNADLRKLLKDVAAEGLSFESDSLLDVLIKESRGSYRDF